MLGDTQMSGTKRMSAGELEYHSACGVSPLVWAANPLLDMLGQIRGMHQLDDPARLRNQLVLEINRFEQRAQSVGVSREDLIGARYCLCTALDEVAALTPWGSHGAWARQSLLVSFHNETWGGEKYYQLLGRLAQNPERHKDLIELLYYCNALGFEGRFRVEENGYSQLETLKRRIATILGNSKGGYEQRLSPHWQGISSTPPAWRLVPPWVVAMLCALVGMGIYIAFMFSLNPRLNATSQNLKSLKLPSSVVQKAFPKPPSNVVKDLCVRLNHRMDQKLVTVAASQEGYCVVTLKGDGLFSSGSTSVRPAYLDVLNGVADAIRGLEVDVAVQGHTDSVPVCSKGLALCSLRFASNEELSQARAESVKKLLDNRLGGTGRVLAEGYGADYPVGDNRKAEGRAKNRRVEISIRRSAQASVRQLSLSGIGQ